jgi:hypothetical protein
MSAHDDYLDPDKHLNHPYDDEETPETLEYADSPCRVSLDHLEQEIEKAISFIERNPKLFAATLKDLFKDAPKGLFKWDAEEAGDWIPSQDDGNWRKDAYSMNMGRNRDGIEWVEFYSVDSDGGWDCTSHYEFKKGKPIDGQTLDAFAYDMAMEHCYYNLLKMRLYSIHVVRTGEDPLADTIGNANPREVHARNLAYEVMDLVASVYKAATEKK